MRIACSITKATNTQSEYVTIIVLPNQHGDLDAPHCYVTFTVPVVLFISCMYVCMYEYMYLCTILFSSVFYAFIIFVIVFYSCPLYPSYFFPIMSYLSLPVLLPSLNSVFGLFLTLHLYI